MSRDALLADLRALCEETMTYVDGVDLEEFLEDRGRQRMVERTMELIGEVAIRLQREAPDLDLPWREMAAMRNLLAHAYHRVDAAVVWRTARQDVPDVLRRTGV